jgi:hypothetical protein
MCVRPWREESAAKGKKCVNGLSFRRQNETRNSNAPSPRQMLATADKVIE